MPRKKSWDISHPQGYVARAKSFATAARLLHEHQKSDFTPYLFCVGHATEVALKGFLMLKGIKEITFPRNPGHDLVKAWRLAVSLGAPIAADPPQWCELINVLHSAPYDARYPRTNLLMGLPDPIVALNGIDGLLGSIETEVLK
jgi:hypothetical protein